MKIIGSVKEDLDTEKRISVTPETIKKFTDLNFSVLLEKNYAGHLGITDEEYKNNGANLYSSAKEVLEKSEIILKVNCPSNNEINSIKDKSIFGRIKSIAFQGAFTELEVEIKNIKIKIITQKRGFKINEEIKFGIKPENLLVLKKS